MSTPARPPRILIVEDEVLIADTLARYLTYAGYDIAGVAAGYEDAAAIVADGEVPDLALLDIHLEGERDGIELAHHLLTSVPEMVRVFLTSQYDRHYLQRAKATLPAGYITKPVQRATLLTTVEVALHNANAVPSRPAHQERLRLWDGQEHHSVAVDDLQFLSVDHVYVEYHRANGTAITVRETLQTALERLPAESFIQVHRKYVVALAHIQSWTSTTVQVAGEVLPVSRGRRAGLAASMGR